MDDEVISVDEDPTDSGVPSTWWILPGGDQLCSTFFGGPHLAGFDPCRYVVVIQRGLLRRR
jgi:hypothetical protein